MSVRFKSPVILVGDIGVSRRFYEQYLEQLVVNDFGDNVTFASGLSLWQGELAREVMPVAAGAKPGGSGFELYFESDDIESVFALLKEAGVEMSHPVREEPWGQRTFRCYDPDGHLVEVAEPLEALVKRLSADGRTPEQIAQRTGMPVEQVLQMIGYPRFC